MVVFMFNYACLGKWKIQSLIGQGAQGRVFLLTQTVGEIKHYTALKEVIIPTVEQRRWLRNSGGTIKQNDVWLEKLKTQVINEVNALYKLKGHPNIMPIEDHYIEPHPEGFGHVVLLRMPYLKVFNAVWQSNGLTKSMVCDWYLDMSNALAACHYAGIVHRDIKPQNMFVESVGGRSVYKLGDFGIATALGHYDDST